MASGYSVFWTNNALDELQSAFDYLEDNFSKKELKFLSREIEKISFLISKNPELFPESGILTGVRKVVVAKFNTLYYRMNKEQIEILSFFSNRQSLSKLNL